MKIEKLNDNQIRCTLTRDDLASRELKLSELICGSEKAKSLFQDMIKQASHEFGFEAEDMPLMIEAIPSSSDSIVLIITKVDNPEELDSKFSKFGSSFSEHDGKLHKSIPDKNILDKLDGADHLIDMYHRIKESLKKESLKQASKKTDASRNTEDDLPFGRNISSQKNNPLDSKETENKDPKTAKIRLFSFSNIDSVIRACQLLKSIYHGANTLYKDIDNAADKGSNETPNVYILVLTRSDHTPDEFYKICNMMSEFGSAERATPALLAFLEEHCEILVSGEAVQQLGNL